MKFNVKDKSLHTFFGIVSDRNSVRGEVSPYYLMQDEIILPKAKHTELNIDENVVFELIDFAQGSQKELQSVYTYTVYDYDSVSWKLELQSHTITSK